MRASAFRSRCVSAGVRGDPYLIVGVARRRRRLQDPLRCSVESSSTRYGNRSPTSGNYAYIKNDDGHALSQSPVIHEVAVPTPFLRGTASGVQNVMMSSRYTGIHLSVERPRRRRRVGGGGMADIYLAIIARRLTGAGARRVAPARGTVAAPAAGRGGEETSAAAGTPAALRKLNSIFVIGFFLVLL